MGRTNVRSAARLKQQLAIGSAVLLAAIVYVSYTVLAVSTAQLLLLLFLFARLVPRLTTVYERARALATTLPAFAAVVAMEERCLAAAAPAVGRAQAIDLTERIAFEHVTFDYREDGRSPAVRDVTLHARRRRHDGHRRSVRVGQEHDGRLADGPADAVRRADSRRRHAARAGHLDAWRDQIGYVAQETFLFHESVRANLLWAKPDATEEDIWHALRLASADAFVRALPHGLDTVVGDRGVLVSGGERQRLSLARALLRRPALLILDEATSSLDSENEARIQQAIDQLHQQMTIVVITHRLSTIRGADMIHVVDRGRLVESGTWTDLVARRTGRFRELCEAQGIDARSEAPPSPVVRAFRPRSSNP